MHSFDIAVSSPAEKWKRGISLPQSLGYRTLLIFRARILAMLVVPAMLLLDIATPLLFDIIGGWGVFIAPMSLTVVGLLILLVPWSVLERCFQGTEEKIIVSAKRSSVLSLVLGLTWLLVINGHEDERIPQIGLLAIYLPAVQSIQSFWTNDLLPLESAFIG